MKIKLKEFRTSHKRLWQAELASVMGVTQSVISRMELRPYVEITPTQYQALCERFGEDDVRAFRWEDDGITISGNTYRGVGNQTNSVVRGNGAEIAVIKEQAEALVELARKQSEQTDKLLAILEKLTDKIQL